MAQTITRWLPLPADHVTGTWGWKIARTWVPSQLQWHTGREHGTLMKYMYIKTNSIYPI